MDTITKKATAGNMPADYTSQLIEPFNGLRAEVDRLFDSFPFGLSALKRLGSSPALEMTETSKNYKITAELPGLGPDDVELTFEDGILRIAGEKREEREQDERGYRLSERSYGAFERLIELPAAANPEKIGAKFKKGVLTVSIAKDGARKPQVRTINIKHES